MSTSFEVIEGETVNNLPYRIVPEISSASNGTMQKVSSTIDKMTFYFKSKWINVFFVTWTIMAFVLYTNFHNGPSNIFYIVFLNGASWFICKRITKSNHFTLIFLTIATLALASWNSGINALVIFLYMLAAIIVQCYCLNIFNLFGGNTIGTASNADCRREVWGVAGTHVGKNVDYGERGKIGAEGEKILGKQLQKLPEKFPHVRVFNGVKFAPYVNTESDIDHVVLIGEKIYFIDAKFWKKAHYYWMRDQYSGESMVYRDGGPFNGGNVHMNGAMEKWYNVVGKYGVLQTRITVVQNEWSGSTYSIDNSLAPEGQALVTLRQLMAELMHEAEISEPIVHRQLVYEFMNNMHK